MFKRVMFLILSLALLVGMGLATTAAFAANGVYGQERWRWEGWNNHPVGWENEEFLSPPEKNVDDSFGYSFLRSRLGYSTDIGEHGIFNICIENTRIFGLDRFGFPHSEPVFWLNDEIVLHEAYLGVADFIFKGFDVYAGRFGNLSYGRERIIGPEDWSFFYKNRFDGFKSHYMFEKGWFDLLDLKINETLLDKYNDERGDTDMRGVYAHFDPKDGLYIEPYVLWLSQVNTKLPEDAKVDNDNFFMFGALIDYMSDMGLHVYGEGVIETGKSHFLGGVPLAQQEEKLSTFGGYVGAFYEADMTSRPFIGAEFNYASGTKQADRDAGKFKTFQSPFGSFSTYMGIMNMVDWSNTASLRFSAGLTPVEKTDVKLDVYIFRLAQAEDDAFGGISFFTAPDPHNLFDFRMSLPRGDITPGVLSTSKSVGTEFDLMVNHQIEENVSVQGGLSMFQYGDYFGKHIFTDATGDHIEDWANTLYGWLGAQVQF